MTSFSIKKPHNAKAIFFKNEGYEMGTPVGPVYFVLEDDTFVPMIDSGRKHFDGSVEAEWLKRTHVENIAREYELPIKESVIEL